MTRVKTALAISAAVLLGTATLPAQAQQERDAQMTEAVTNALNSIADYYVVMTLQAGTYDAEYVDSYYGDPAVRTAAEAGARGIESTRIKAASILFLLDQLPARALSPIERRRVAMLRGQATAAGTRLQMIAGRRFSFADEARGLFGVEVTTRPLSDFDPILAQLDRSIPGTGSLPERVDAFNERYTIPADRLRPVFDAAIAECRRRTMLHMTLPAGESFTMEFVTDKPWSGYNYYQGNYRSLIQINTDLPIRISRAVDLGCHEGYPGHHVLNLMVESRLARGPADGVPGGRGWNEYLVNPLYSPTSVISEGSANYGIDLAFSPAERLAFERDILYPLAGLDPASAEAFWQVQQATEALGGARLTIAQQYLDGVITRGEAVALTQRYLLLSPARAEQSVAFTDHYRSYVLNYGWGRDLVRTFVERGAPDGTLPDTATRWRRMEAILSEPTLPGDLTPG